MFGRARKLLGVVGGVAVTLVGVLAPVAQANAAGEPTASGREAGSATAAEARDKERSAPRERVSVPMTVVGFDPEVAAANGYPTTPPPVEPSDGEVSIQGSVFGNCGFSYVELYDAGVRRYRMDTGFGLNSSAVSYDWSVRVTAPGYDRTWNYGGGLWFRSTWTNADAYDTIPRGAWTSAIVTRGEATLANGQICRTGQPTDLQAIY